MEHFFRVTIYIDGNVATLDDHGVKVKSKPYSFIIIIYVKI